MIIPKQWKHWCADSRLKQHGRGQKGGPRQWMYLKGRGRYWRVNIHGAFQCGDTYEDFDRWALCKIHESSLPKSRAEFRATVRRLLEKHLEENPVKL